MYKDILSSFAKRKSLLFFPFDLNHPEVFDYLKEFIFSKFSTARNDYALSR